MFSSSFVLFVCFVVVSIFPFLVVALRRCALRGDIRFSLRVAALGPSWWLLWMAWALKE